MMGFIPFHQIVSVIKSKTLDDWGEPCGSGKRKYYKARIDYSSRNQEINGAKGKETVLSAKIILQGLVAVSYDDHIEFTDKLGTTRTFSPINIVFREDLGGNVLFTVVEV